jgi:hypothetical protein
MKIPQPILGGMLLGIAFCATSTAHAQDETPARALNAPDGDATTIAANDFKIEPGVRAGALLLGMNSRAVLTLMGKPSELFQRSEGIEEIVWHGAKDTETRVILGADAVIQINVSDPKYRDLLGNGISSPLKTIFARYRAKGYAQPKEAVYNIEDPAGGGYEAHIYDDVETGIAYHLGVQDDFDLSAPPDVLIVHRAGKAAHPARGGTPVTPAQIAARDKANNAPSPAPPRLNTVPRALGTGLPLTEVVTGEGVRAWRTNAVILPGRVFVSGLSIVKGPNNQSLWNPIVSLYITASQDRPVWQDVSQVTFSWGYRRLALSASKETVADNSGQLPLTSTVLRVRFPYQDFCDLARAGKFVITVSGASFPVDKPQTVGLRALARISGAADVTLENGTSSGRSFKAPAPVSNRAPVSGANEFFPQTRRRALRQSEARD